jgi:hypothetical protein
LSVWHMAEQEFNADEQSDPPAPAEPPA